MTPRRRARTGPRLGAIAACALACAALPGTASAATGDLVFNGCVGDLSGCTTTTPTNALDGAHTSALSPDGKQLYVVTDTGTADDVSHFTLNALGVPIFDGCVGSSSGCTPTTPTHAILGAWGVAVSPNGQHLYVTSDTSANLSYFNLDGSGDPTFAGCVGDGTGCTPTSPVFALSGGTQPIFSPDGSHLYVPSFDGDLSYLSVNSSGVPTLLGCIGQTTGCTPISTAASALNGSNFAAMKSDGSQLYVAATENDVAHFSINGLGVPSFVDCVGNVSGCASTSPATALNGADGIALSPDAKHLYVVSNGSSDLTYLTLGTMGSATSAGCIGDLSGCTPTNPAGVLASGTGTALTPDGTQLYTGSAAGGISHFSVNGSGIPAFVSCIGPHAGCTATSPSNAVASAFQLTISADGQHVYSSDRTANNLSYMTLEGPTAPPTKPTCTLTVQNSAVFASADTPAVAAKHKKKKKHAKGVIKLTATCNQATTLTLAGKLTARSRAKGKKKKGKKRAFTLTAGPVQAAAGIPTTLTVKLSKAALKLLRKHAKESITFTLTATNSNGSGTATATIAKLKLKR